MRTITCDCCGRTNLKRIDVIDVCDYCIPDTVARDVGAVGMGFFNGAIDRAISLLGASLSPVEKFEACVKRLCCVLGGGRQFQEKYPNFASIADSITNEHRVMLCTLAALSNDVDTGLDKDAIMVEANAILCEALIGLGFGKLVHQYEEVKRKCNDQ